MSKLVSIAEAISADNFASDYARAHLEKAPEFYQAIHEYLVTLRSVDIGKEGYSPIEIAKIAIADELLKTLDLPIRQAINDCKQPTKPYTDADFKVLSELIRWEVFRRDGFSCKGCGSQLRLTVDHIIPKSKGGTHTEGNLQTLCRSCNSRKGTRLDGAAVGAGA